MSLRHVLPVLALSGALVSPLEVMASGDEPPKSVPAQNEPSPGRAARTPEEKAAQDRKEAEGLYRAGWDEVEKAKAEMKQAAETAPDAAKDADKLRQSAQKRLKKALDRFRTATDLDPAYHEAWNMLGYCYRKTGQLGNASAAYRACLKLMPDYAEAHEYLAELALLTGNPKKAQDELAWLRKADRKDLADRLAAAIERQAAGADSAALQSLDW